MSAWWRNKSRGRALELGLGLVLALSVQPRAAAQESAVEERVVGLELVLAVDASSSVSVVEFALQMGGLARAFRRPEVVEAIRVSGDLGIAVALVQWSDARKQFLAVGWHWLRDAAGAAAFAARIDATPRYLIGGGTAIGGALKYATAQFQDNGFSGLRKIIDLSGDGRTNQGAHPEPLRDAAVAQGITINGLAILNEDPAVDSYYRYYVIGGAGAFVMTANDYRAYEDAIIAKLVREIAAVPVAQAPAPERVFSLAARP